MKHCTSISHFISLSINPRYSCNHIQHPNTITCPSNHPQLYRHPSDRLKASPQHIQYLIQAQPSFRQCRAPPNAPTQRPVPPPLGRLVSHAPPRRNQQLRMRSSLHLHGHETGDSMNTTGLNPNRSKRVDEMIHQVVGCVTSSTAFPMLNSVSATYRREMDASAVVAMTQDTC